MQTGHQNLNILNLPCNNKSIFKLAKLNSLDFSPGGIDQECTRKMITLRNSIKVECLTHFLGARQKRLNKAAREEALLQFHQEGKMNNQFQVWKGMVKWGIRRNIQAEFRAAQKERIALRQCFCGWRKLVVSREKAIQFHRGRIYSRFFTECCRAIWVRFRKIQLQQFLQRNHSRRFIGVLRRNREEWRIKNKKAIIFSQGCHEDVLRETFMRFKLEWKNQWLNKQNAALADMFYRRHLLSKTLISLRK